MYGKMSRQRIEVMETRIQRDGEINRGDQLVYMIMANYGIDFACMHVISVPSKFNLAEKKG